MQNKYHSSPTRTYPTLRSAAAIACLSLSLALTACGGDSDTTGLASSMKTQATAKAGRPPPVVQIQPNQSLTGLWMNAGEQEQEYQLTLPIGTTAMKIQVVGTGAPLLNLSDRPDMSTSTQQLALCMVDARTCQMAFAPLSATKSYYFIVGTRTSYTDTTITSFVSPAAIPLESGQPISSLAGNATDPVTYYTVVVPPGASTIHTTVTGGTGVPPKLYFINLVPIDYNAYGTGTLDVTLTSKPPGTYYIFLTPGAPAATYQGWTLTATVS